jgi:hypothetical protein
MESSHLVGLVFLLDPQLQQKDLVEQQNLMVSQLQLLGEHWLHQIQGVK